MARQQHVISMQTLPVRVYQTDDQIMVAAPMPGLEPEDISVSIHGDRIAVRGEQRGPRQHERDLVIDEWTIGPYYREVALPHNVDGALSNATYGNGVLVLSMPKIRRGQVATHANFQLQPIDAVRGERIGHAGKQIRPLSTQQHRKKHRAGRA